MHLHSKLKICCQKKQLGLNSVRGKYVQLYPKNNLPALPGIKFFSDSQGRKTAVLIDLKEHWKLWADIIEKHDLPPSLQFLNGEDGKKTAVLLDFKKNLLWFDRE